MTNTKKEKFFKHINHCLKQEEKGELINFTEIYEDYGCPDYKSPKRILHYPRGKEFIEFQIRENNMEVEKVIRYEDDRIFGNFELALEYLYQIEPYNFILITDLIYRRNPTILEEFRNFQINQ